LRSLVSGSLTARLEDASLRQVTVSGHRALTAVYVTVRDDVWRTAPAQIVLEETHRTPDGSSITEMVVRHRLGAVDFQWQGTVISTQRSIEFTMVGEALSDFAANRIGFCLLHPQSLKGRRLRIDGPGGHVEGAFSPTISPHQPFTDITAMSYQVSNFDELAIAFGGELFEMEDHRNWSDPGWKTYCTPLSRPVPVRYQRGQRIEQVVELTCTSRMPPADRGARPGSAEHVTISVDRGTVVGRIPELGLGASGRPGLAEDIVPSLRALAPRFVHVELEHAGRWREWLDSATAEATSLDLPLEVALVAPVAAIESLAAEAASRCGPIVRAVSVFSPDTHTTNAGTVSSVRRTLQTNGCDAAVGGGSRANFAELNRGRFDVDTWAFVTYGVSPQVHHTDDDTILDTTAALADALDQASIIGRGRPITVGPITLRPRFNAYSGRADLLPDPGEAGHDVDERQAAPIAGVYLAAALTELVRSDRVIAFRTVGVRGILDEDGQSTPASRVFGEWSRRCGAPIHPSRSDHPKVTASAASSGGRFTLIVTNRSSRRVTLTLAGAEARDVRVLTEDRSAEPGAVELPGRSVVLLGLGGPETTKEERGT